MAMPVLAALHIPTASELAQITDAIDVVYAAWGTWTPTLTNLTLGNGSVIARYHEVGKTVDYRFVFTLGSTSAISGIPRFTLPAAVHASGYGNTPIGDVDLTNAATNSYRGIAKFVSGSTVEIFGYTTTGVQTAVNATTPFAFGTSDSISVTGRYERT